MKYFRDFYPYFRKDRIAAAIKPRQFCLVTDKNFVENIRRLALMEALTVNEFMVKVLSDFAIQELENEPSLFQEYIPDY